MIILSFFILVAFAAFFIFKKEMAANFFSVVLSYPQKAITTIVDVAHAPFRWIALRKNILAESDYLKKENFEVLSENTALKESLRETEFVRQEFEVGSMKEFALVNTRVIGYAPGILGDYYVIDKGTADGVSDGMMVVTNGKVLLGKVYRAHTTTSAVYAIVRDGSKISAMLADKNDVAGIVSAGNGKLKFELSGDMAAIEDNTLLLTAGIDGKFPRGFLVGRVHFEQPKIQNDQMAGKDFSVSPLVSFSSVQYVYVITDQRFELISHP